MLIGILQKHSDCKILNLHSFALEMDGYEQTQQKTEKTSTALPNNANMHDRSSHLAGIWMIQIS